MGIYFVSSADDANRFETDRMDALSPELVAVVAGRVDKLAALAALARASRGCHSAVRDRCAAAGRARIAEDADLPTGAVAANVVFEKAVGRADGDKLIAGGAPAAAYVRANVRLHCHVRGYSLRCAHTLSGTHAPRVRRQQSSRMCGVFFLWCTKENLDGARRLPARRVVEF